MSTDVGMAVAAGNHEPRRLVDLDIADCLGLLAAGDVGRIGVVIDGRPIVLPISYRLTSANDRAVIAIRTRPGGTMDQVDQPVCFEIDGVDPGRDGGWSVVVLGTLVAVAPDGHVDPRPLLPEDRDAWRMVVPTTITGRRLEAAPRRWTFDPHGYL